MKFVVIGAGAIGAYVGACLARGGVDVTLVARGVHLQAMRERGVRVQSAGGDFVSHPTATDDFEAVADAGVVFVGLKAYSLPDLAPQIGRYLRPATRVVWAQNGLPWWYFQSEGGPFEGTRLESTDPAGVISDAFAPAHNIGCVAYCSTEIVEPGVIRHVEGTRFIIGEPDGSGGERCQEISKMFASGGLKAPIETRIRNQIWLKLVGNVSFNPVSALTLATLGELGSDPEVVELLRKMFDECALVAARLGVVFPVSLERRLSGGLGIGDHKTSMLQDLEAGKELELDCMSGAVIELAEKIGVEVPNIRAVHACAKLLGRTSAAKVGRELAATERSRAAV